MKRFLLLFFIVTTGLSSKAQISSVDFVTTWRTDIAGSSAANQITIPASGEYTLYYESIPAGISGLLPISGAFIGEQTITLPAVGTYRIAIKPVGVASFHQIRFNNSGDKDKILTIEQWGTTLWSSLESAYFGCSSLSAISAIDVPNLSKVTSMSLAFAQSALMSAPSINNWNVSGVTNMETAFWGAQTFDQPLDNWDVSAVTNMYGMFAEAHAFNQPIDSWDVSQVITMGQMFAEARAFNQPLDDWNVSNVLDMEYLFYNAGAFNQSLGKWTFNSSFFSAEMLSGSGMDCSNYSKSLIGWAANPNTPAGRILDATNRSFGPAAATARSQLVTTKGWRILGDNLDPTCEVLPVKLIAFSVKVLHDDKVELNWRTAHELNNDHFIIERSTDLISFERIAAIRDVAGNSDVVHSYRFVDPQPYSGTSYYRLSQYDADGTRSTSRAVSVIVRSLDYSLYPNPLVGQMICLSVDDPELATISLYNVRGEKIALETYPDGPKTLKLKPLRQLASGVYLINVGERATKRTYKLIVE